MKPLIGTANNAEKTANFTETGHAPFQNESYTSVMAIDPKGAAQANSLMKLIGVLNSLTWLKGAQEL
jgi:hypothetical protein